MKFTSSSTDPSGFFPSGLDPGGFRIQNSENYKKTYNFLVSNRNPSISGLVFFPQVGWSTWEIPQHQRVFFSPIGFPRPGFFPVGENSSKNSQLRRVFFLGSVRVFLSGPKSGGPEFFSPHRLLYLGDRIVWDCHVGGDHVKDALDSWKLLTGNDATPLCRRGGVEGIGIKSASQRGVKKVSENPENFGKFTTSTYFSSWNHE